MPPQDHADNGGGTLTPSACGNGRTPEEKLRELASAGSRLAILGVGNRLRGDDAFGPMLVERLRGRLDALCIDAGTTPENQTGPVIRHAPTLVLILDTAEMGEEPGALRLLESAAIEGFSTAGTHSMSLRMVSGYLEGETGAPVFLLAAQPASLAMGEPPGKEIVRALDRAEAMLLRLAGRSG